MKQTTKVTKLAALVATKDRPGMLASRSLTSIERQHRRPEVLVVVEDGPSTRIVRDIVNDVRMTGASIVYLPNTRTPGASGAWNTGIEYLARHYGTDDLFVAILDDDDEWAPEHLEQCARKAMSDGLDMVIAGLIRHTEDEERRRSIPEGLDPEELLVGNPHVQGSNLFVSSEASSKPASSTRRSPVRRTATSACA